MRFGSALVLIPWAACHGKDDPPTDDGVDLVPVDLLERGVQTCDGAGDRDALGPYSRHRDPIDAPSDPSIWHGGVVAADVNGDGWLDVITALENGLELYEGNPSGTFDPRGAQLFAGIDLTFASGGAPADYDGDGDLDLYITRIVGFPAPEGGDYGINRLLQNQGTGTFVDVTDEAGVDGCGEDFRDGATKCFKSMASSWGDYDHDGDLDLYVGNYGFVDETDGTRQEDMEPAERDFLYRNEGDGTFSDVSDLLSREFHDGYTYAGGFHDLDADGDLDLYTVNDFGTLWPNRVMWNEGDGTFSFVSPDPSRLDLPMTGMGLGIGDLNGDGWPDLAIAEWKRDTLLESRPDLGLWVGVGDQKGFGTDWHTTSQEVGWGTEMGDVDNDGDLDIVNQYGHLESENGIWGNSDRQPDGLFLNEPDGDTYRFVEAGEAWGIADMSMTRGVVLADINRDGWLDMAKRSLDANNVVYLSRCGDEAWLTIDLVQPGTMNTRAVGARVEIRAGGQQQTRTVVAGGTGYASSPPPEVHFGLGDLDRIDEVVIHWPDGTLSAITDLTPRQWITVTRRP